MTTHSINPLLLVGALILGLAILAGFVAAWLNIRACRGPKERRLVSLCTLVVWALILSLLVLMGLLPPPGRYWLLAPYFIVIPGFVYWVSLRRQMLRVVERREGASGND